MNKRNLVAVVLLMVIAYSSSCYKNKEDISAISIGKVSFRKEVVPIVTSGSCGCHNNGLTRNAIQFQYFDTILRVQVINYDVILARKALLNAWVNGGTHPGGGAIYFSPSETALVKKWLDEGGEDDGEGCGALPAVMSYSRDIAPIYTTTCKGPSCHGGLGPTLDLNKMRADVNILTAMMNSRGSSGHPGGALSLSICTVNKFKEWIKQGQPQ